MTELLHIGRGSVNWDYFGKMTQSTKFYYMDYPRIPMYLLYSYEHTQEIACLCAPKHLRMFSAALFLLANWKHPNGVKYKIGE